MTESYWKKLSTRTLFTHPRLTVVEDDVMLPQGKQTKYLRYENLQDYVTVIAERDGYIALIREYSYPHDEWLWQLPEGSIEAGEDALASAHRELKEEADLEAKSVIPIGMNYGHHRRSDEKDYIFVATSISEVEKTGGDAEEIGTTMQWFPIAKIKEMISTGKIRQKNVLAALALYLVHDHRN